MAKLTIEVDAAELDKAIESAYQKNKGKISIPFNNEEELERIVGILDKLK